MKEYHKIQTVYKRNQANNNKTLLEGDFSMPEFEYLKGCEWVFTEKIDGMNIRVMWDGNKITFGGKTDNASIPTKLVEKLTELFPSADKFRENFADTKVCLYGEGYGARIQKAGGNYIPNGVSFVLFDIKIREWWLMRDSVEELGAAFSLNVAPIIGRGTLMEMVEKVRRGFSSQWGKFDAEGIVARPAVEMRTRSGHRIITKIKLKDFIR
jgi:hypothetical protein